jgi:hypothetical protein
MYSEPGAPAGSYYAATAIFKGWNKFEGKQPVPDRAYITFDIGKADHFEIVQTFNLDGSAKSYVIAQNDKKIGEGAGYPTLKVGSAEAESGAIAKEALRRFQAGGALPNDVLNAKSVIYDPKPDAEPAHVTLPASESGRSASCRLKKEAPAGPVEKPKTLTQMAEQMNAANKKNGSLAKLFECPSSP